VIEARQNSSWRAAVPLRARHMLAEGGEGGGELLMLSAGCDGVSVERSPRERVEGRREPRNRHPSACGEEAAADCLPAACRRQPQPSYTDD
jgi:hypothetical protein